MKETTNILFETRWNDSQKCFVTTMVKKNFKKSPFAEIYQLLPDWKKDELQKKCASNSHIETI